MRFTKEDLDDLTIFELMQNAWCYTVTVLKGGEKTPEFARNYSRWCEELLFEK